MISKLRNCQNLPRKRGIFVIVCGICRSVDKKQISRWHNWPRKRRKCCTKMMPNLHTHSQRTVTRTFTLLLGHRGCSCSRRVQGWDCLEEVVFLFQCVCSVRYGGAVSGQGNWHFSILRLVTGLKPTSSSGGATATATSVVVWIDFNVEVRVGVVVVHPWPVKGTVLILRTVLSILLKLRHHFLLGIPEQYQGANLEF